MTLDCAKTRERLDDWVDGTLEETERHEIRGHLERCAGCRGELDALEELRAEAARLAREIQPPRDLWPAIESRLERRWWQRLLEPAALGAGLRPAPILVAGAAVLAAALAVWLWRSQPAPTAGPTPAAEAVATRVDPTFASRAELARSEDGMLLAHRDLIEAVERQRDRMSPETVAILEQNLLIIDQAIGQIRSALAEDPLNTRLRLQLAAHYQHEVHLLKRVSGV